MKITSFILILTIVSFSSAFAQSDPFAKVKTPEDATAYLKLISESYKEGDETLLPILISKGADVDVVNKFGMTPLFMAVLANSTQGVKTLLDASANPDVLKPISKETPLFYAAQKKNLEMLNALINAKADINLASARGLTPLFIASVKKADDIVAALINAGADPNIYDKKTSTSPLYIAAENGHYKNLSALLKAGADIDHQKTDGSTALFIASSNAHTAIVIYLLANKANKHLTATIENMTRAPLLEAQVKKHHDIVKLLNKGLPRCNKSFEQGIWDVFVMPDYYSIKLTFDKVDQSLSHGRSLSFTRSPNGGYSFDTNLGVRYGIHQIFVDGIKVFEGKFERQSNGKGLKITPPSIDLKTLQKLSKGKIAELRIMDEKYKKEAAQTHAVKFPLGELRAAFYKAENDLKLIITAKNEGRCYQSEGFAIQL